MEYPIFYYAQVSGTFVKLTGPDKGMALTMTKQGDEFDFRLRSIDGRWAAHHESESVKQYYPCDENDWAIVARRFAAWTTKKLASTDPELVKLTWEATCEKLRAENIE